MNNFFFIPGWKTPSCVVFLFSFSSKNKEEFLNFNAMRGVRMDSCSQAARRENAA